MRFGTIIQQMRMNRGWDLTTFGRHANMTRTYLGLLERGLNMPSLECILHLAAVFGVDAGDLVRQVAAGRPGAVVPPTVPSK